MISRNIKNENRRKKGAKPNEEQKINEVRQWGKEG